MKIYRFRSAEQTLRIFSSFQMRLSNPLYFNDKSEFWLDIDTKKFAAKWKLRAILPVMEQHENDPELRKLHTREEWDAMEHDYNCDTEDFRGTQAGFLAHVDSSMESVAESSRSEWRSEVSLRFRILSFCRQPNSDRLWAHYADTHKGAALCFDTDSMSLPSEWEFQPVKYQDHAPVVSFQDFDDRKRRDEHLRKTLSIKHTQWADEDEVRLIAHGGPLDLDGGLFPKFETEMLDVSSGLEKVIFGLDTEYDFREEVLSRVAKLNEQRQNKIEVLDCYKKTHSVMTIGPFNHSRHGALKCQEALKIKKPKQSVT